MSASFAPFFELPLGPIHRCWQCKLELESSLDYSCELFPAKAFCGVNCARCYIETYEDICERQRSSLTIQLTQWCIENDIDPLSSASCDPWWKSFSKYALCWGCFQTCDAGMSCVMDVSGQKLGKFCGGGCIRRFIRERQMDASYKSRVIEWTKETKNTCLGCDWRLHRDFGGMFDTLPDMALNVQLPLKSDKLLVLWKTNELPSVESEPLATCNEDFMQWVRSKPSEVGVRMGHGPDAEETTVTPYVASILNGLASDDPIAVWHKRNKSHEKAKKYVLFRKETLPFNLHQNSMADPVLANDSDDDQI